MLPSTLRRSAPLLALLLACAPGKDDSAGDASSSAGSTTTTIGHSSAPTGGDPEPTPTSSVSATSPGTSTPPDPSTTTAEPPPGTISETTNPTTPTSATSGDPTEGDDDVPFSPIETTVAFIVTPPDLPPGECDPWQENCPEGAKCMPFATDGSPTWNAVKCVPLADDPRPPGAPCSVADHPTSGIDNCELHSMCWDLDAELHGTCVPLCTGDGFNSAVCPGGNICVRANDNVLLLCLPRCDPLLVDCAADQVCIPTGTDFACAPDASGDAGHAFEPCAAGNTCDPGLVCARSSHTALCSANADECCLPFCDLDEQDPCPPDTACIPWFPKGGALPDLLDVGLCGEP